jgi:hypothetical protein
MFVAGEESRFNGSDFEPSHIDRDLPKIGAENIGKAASIMSENAQDKNRYLIDNFDILETISIGSLSTCYKLRGKTSGASYLLKVTRKIKYGSKKRSVY